MPLYHHAATLPLLLVVADVMLALENHADCLAVAACLAAVVDVAYLAAVADVVCLAVEAVAFSLVLLQLAIVDAVHLLLTPDADVAAVDYLLAAEDCLPAVALAADCWLVEDAAAVAAADLSLAAAAVDFSLAAAVADF